MRSVEEKNVSQFGFPALHRPPREAGRRREVIDNEGRNLGGWGRNGNGNGNAKIDARSLARTSPSCKSRKDDKPPNN